MNLLIVFPSMERGGAEGYALTVARSSIEAGWQVDVAFPYSPATESLVAEFRQAGAQWRPLAIGRAATILGRRPRPLVPWVEFLNSLRHLLCKRPDALLIVLPGPSACFPVQMAAASLGIPAASCFQLTPRDAWMPSEFRKRLLHWARGRGQQWISVSQHNREFVSNAFEVSPDEIRVIPNGARMDFAARGNAEDRAAARRKLDIPENAQVALTVARLGKQKAHAELLDAMARVSEDLPDLHLLWVGEGELRSLLEEQISNLDLTNRVHMLGFRKDVPYWMSVSDYFVFPTHYEGLPFSVVEAMAAGLPIIASRVSSLPEILEDGSCGLLVDSNDADAWERALRQALGHPEDLLRKAEKARERAALYSESAMASQTLETLRGLVERGRGK